MYKRGGYGAMLSGRFGNIAVPVKANGKKRIWIQAVSVGELLAIESIIRELSVDTNFEIVLTTTTSTGYQVAKEKYSEHTVAIHSFPLDFWFFVRKSWKCIQPDLAIITEGELWPEHIHVAKSLKIPLLLINARLSDRSYKRMSSFKWLQPLFYQNIHQIGASSEIDSKRIVELGFDSKQIHVSGNLKFDVVDPEGMSEGAKAELRDQTSLKNKKGYTIIGASTWPGEEALLLDACLELKNRGFQVELLLVPRHAERRGELKSLLRKYDRINWQFRSEKTWQFTSVDSQALEVYIADTTGELRQFLQIADVAVIGKSFPPYGEGQTPVEAVALGVPVVYGGAMTNFRAICADLEQNDGSLRVRSPEHLVVELEELLKDGEKRMRMVNAARTVFEGSRGSTQRTLSLIKSYF